MNSDERQLLMEVHTSVCGRGGLLDRMDKNTEDIEELKKFRWGFGGVITLISALVSALVTHVVKGVK